MEEKAIDFTRRIVECRLLHYKAGGAEIFFEKSIDDIWRELFYATMANPRLIGYILHYLHESNLIFDNKIGVKSIRQASRKYFCAPCLIV